MYGIVPPTGPEFCYGSFFCDLFNLENSCDLGNLQLADPVKENPFLESLRVAAARGLYFGHG